MRNFFIFFNLTLARLFWSIPFIILLFWIETTFSLQFSIIFLKFNYTNPLFFHFFLIFTLLYYILLLYLRG